MGPSTHAPTGPLILALLGVGLLVVGLQTAHFGEQPEFHHEIRSGPASEAALNDTIDQVADGSIERSDVFFEYSDLSSSAREVVRESLAAEDGRVTYRGAGRGAPEFAYSGDFQALGHGEYIVAYENDYYRLSTSADSGFPGLPEQIAAALLFAIGAPLTLFGLARTDRARVTASTLFGLGSVTLLSVVGFAWFEVTGLVALIGVGLATGAITGLVAWVVIGRLSAAVGSPASDGSVDRSRGVGVAYGSLGVLVMLGLYAFGPGQFGFATLEALCLLGFASGAALEWHRAALVAPQGRERAGGGHR